MKYRMQMMQQRSDFDLVTISVKFRQQMISPFLGNYNV